MNYKQLQTELKALRERGLVDPNLKLNAPNQVLAKAYIEYEGKQERKQILSSPILMVWLTVACLSLLIGMVCLALILVMKLYSFVVITKCKTDSILSFCESKNNRKFNTPSKSHKLIFNGTHY